MGGGNALYVLAMPTYSVFQLLTMLCIVTILDSISVIVKQMNQNLSCFAIIGLTAASLPIQ
jgi:hypothetical protein